MTVLTMSKMLPDKSLRSSLKQKQKQKPSRKDPQQFECRCWGTCFGGASKRRLRRGGWVGLD
jgi:hypothetical protein